MTNYNYLFTGGIGGSGSGGGFDQHGGYSQQVQIQQTPQKNWLPHDI